MIWLLLKSHNLVPLLPEGMTKALGDLLEGCDPLRKAERATARKEKSAVASPGKENQPC